MSNSEQNIRENAKIRQAMRREYIRQIYDPYRNMTGEGGHIFDTGIQRYLTARVCSYHTFKPSPQSAIFALGFLVFPLFGYGYLLKSSREKQEEKYRTGQVAYKDRKNKFI